MLKSVAAGLAGLACLVLTASAADLDVIGGGGGAPPRVIEGLGPPPPRRFVPRPPPSPCHVIAAPGFNLSQDDVVRADPEVVCLSRGLYTDSVNR